MTSKYTYNICGRTFASKKAVKEHVQQNIHSQYPDHESLSKADQEFMVGLLRYHPWGDQKVGIGVKRMWLQRNGIFPTRGFWLERIDGTKTDFSFYQCVEAASVLRDFKAACRTALAGQMIQFRLQWFQKHGENGKVVCPLSGNAVSIHESHVDHAPPNTFDEIVMDFIADNKIDVNEAPLADHSDGNVGGFFTDQAFKEKWIGFHNERASLRVLSAKANLSNKA